MDASEKVEIVEEFYRHPMMKEFQGLMKKTNTIKPKKKYVERLQEMLNACPTLIRICMNSAQQACESLIKGANATGATKEFWRAEMVDLKSKLSYRESTELEKLLIEQVIMCWLRMYITEHKYAKAIYQSLWLITGSDAYQRASGAPYGRVRR